MTDGIFKKPPIYEEHELYFTNLSTKEDTHRFFNILFLKDNARVSLFSYIEEHLQGKEYVFNNSEPEYRMYPNSFHQTVILLSQLLQDTKRYKLYDANSFAQRIKDGVIGNTEPVVIDSTRIAFNIQEGMQMIGLGYRNDEEKEILQYNISEIAELNDYIYTFPVREK